jgi:tricorn protease
LALFKLDHFKEVLPMKKWPVLFLLGFMLIWFIHPAQAEEARLLRQPTASAEQIAFVYANDIWIASKSGGETRRLTTHFGTETNPVFSPDGKTIAFSGQYDGNTDVYIVPSEGGEPKRLTYHPYGDIVRGWTVDGERVLFASGRDTVPVPFNRLWTVSIDGGIPESLPLPMADKGVYSPDGTRMAYVRLQDATQTWRHYRGGQTTAVWLIGLEDFDLEKIPRDNSNDTDPMWIGDKVYFLSDRNHTVNLFSYDLNSKDVKQLTFHEDFDIKEARAGGCVIVYEQAGFLHVYEPSSGQSIQLHMEIRGDLPGLRPHFAKVSDLIKSAHISPTGIRAVIEARGDIFTLPAEKGDVRNITKSSGANDRFPKWSPDGTKIAYFSDESGEYELKIIDQKGQKRARSITLVDPSFYYEPVWSPDSKKIAFADKRLNLWFIDVESKKAERIDKDTYDHPYRSLDHVWSPDSKWISYSKRLDNHMHALFLYSLEEGRSFQLTDGLSDAISPAFDAGGKYLYFLASTNFGLNTGWLDMSSYERPFTRGVYLVVLNAEDPSPLLPESDEEGAEAEENENKDKNTIEPGKEKEDKDKDKTKDEKKEVNVRIVLKGISQRILAVDIPLRNYSQLNPAAEGVFFYAENIPNQEGLSLHKYDLKKRESKPFLSGITGYTISADGKKLLYFTRDTYGIVETSKEAKVGDGKLKTEDLQMRVDPVAEWRQIYREAWRINRDYLYDAKMHGADWDAMYTKYEPFLKHVAHRSDLSYILQNLIGELTIGHSWAAGGALPRIDRVPVGLLGADYEIADGYYKIAKIYTEENWNPGLQAPLTAPGLNVNQGNFILEVNGYELKAPTNLYKLFEGTAGKQTTIRVNDKPSREGSRLITVVPIGREWEIRTRDWIEDNRRKVDQMSHGQLAYVYLPNTAEEGYINFNRYYFAQQNKQGAVIDERFNGGGSAADYFVDLMSRPLMNYFATRDGKEFTTPAAQIFGPKVMIINEYAGSGGDALPYYFRFRKIGPLIGKTTWGGLVGHHGGVDLIDGGFISSPNLAFYNTEGEWDVENEGVAPDIEIEMTPALVIQGKDPQLERAVEEALKLLEQNPFEHTPRPAPIDRVSKKK